VSLPAADDLFRATSTAEASAPAAGSEPDRPAPGRVPSGRVRHDEKMTVYVTADELLDLEHARLALRLVREAIAIALADLDANGDDSVIVQRLTQA
jgi:hypothetical protein